MSAEADLKTTVLGYFDAVRTLVTNPSEFFSQTNAAPEYRMKLLFALPPILVYSVGVGVLAGKPLLIPLNLLIAYGLLGIWTVSLKYVLIIFGERRTFLETLQIAASAAVVFYLAWIPVVGAPVAVLATGLLTIFGLTHGFNMHRGAALTAVALPIVVLGVVVGLLTWLLIFLSSITSVFTH